MFISIINGPNLNMLGGRQPEVYGVRTLADINGRLMTIYTGKIELRFFQSNSEGEIITRIQLDGNDPGCKGIVLNAGAYTHYSYAIADAIAAVCAPVVEVHISNIAAREEFRTRSVIAPVCAGSVSGFGEDSYRLAVSALVDSHL